MPVVRDPLLWGLVNTVLPQEQQYPTSHREKVGSEMTYPCSLYSVLIGCGGAGAHAR